MRSKVMKDDRVGGKPHPAIEMKMVGRSNFKSKPTNHFRSGFNVWYVILECPIGGCDTRISRNQNASNGRSYHCIGTKIVSEKRNKS